MFPELSRTLESARVPSSWSWLRLFCWCYRETQLNNIIFREVRCNSDTCCKNSDFHNSLFRNVKVQGISFDPQRSTTLLHTLQCCSIQARVFLAGCCRPAKVTPTSAGCPMATVFCQTRGASHLLMASSWGNTNQPPHRRGLSPYRQLVAYLPSSPPPCPAIPRTQHWCIGSQTAGLNYYLTTFYKWSGLLALAVVISGEYLETDTLLIQIRYPA